MNDRDVLIRGIHTDCLLNYETVKYFNGEQHEGERYREAIRQYQGFEYNADRAYFHSFAGDVSGGGLWRGWAGMLIYVPEMHDRVRVCGRGRGEDVREEGDEAE